MNAASYVVLALVVLVLAAAVRYLVRQRRRGGCPGCSGCSGCCRDCEYRKKK